jgi:hypothetical protein
MQWTVFGKMTHCASASENQQSGLLTRIKSLHYSKSKRRNQSVIPPNSIVGGGTNNSIVSTNANSDLRRREVVLAKISLYMVFVFLICHSVKIVPNIYEMVQTYLAVSLFEIIQTCLLLARKFKCHNSKSDIPIYS